MTDELKPCPFCGNRDIEMITDHGNPYEHTVYLIFCKECSGMIEKWFDTKQEAIQAWNRRVEK